MQDDPTSARAAGDGDTPPPASVAEEAALLVDLLSRRGWPGSSGLPPTRSRAQAVGGSGTSTDDASRPRSDGGPEPAERPGRHEQQGPGQCTCGGATPSACRVCPVCQVIALVQQVSPDTIEKVADFVGFAATALRDLATAQRERKSAEDTARDPRDETDRTGPGGTA
jgi:hypothetical protein